jgi:hypothetical protein
MSLPELKTQLRTGSGTEDKDCGPATVVNLILWASDGKVGPKNQHEMGAWVKLVRRWARNSNAPFRLRRDALRAYKHPELAYRFKKAGLKPLSATYYFDIRWSTLAKYVVHNGVHLAVDYGILRQGKAPMGSPTFNGGHSLAMIGGSKPAGSHYLFTNVGDPLFDGRRKSIPDGYQYTRMFNYREAAGKFGSFPPGGGKATCVVVRKGR